MCFNLNFSASWTHGARSLGVNDFHFLPENREKIVRIVFLVCDKLIWVPSFEK